MRKDTSKKFSLKRKHRPLRALQVEVTSRCSKRCHVCPRTFFPHDWHEGDLSEETFRAVEKGFHLAEHIHLQGWGESLLHPRISDYARRARDAGCTVGITTSGDVLEENLDWLSEGSVTHLTLSLAGMGSMNKKLRGGADAEDLFRSIALLAGRTSRAEKGPKIQINYLLTRENHAEMRRVVERAGSSGADEVYVTHLDVCPVSTLYELAAYRKDSLLWGVEDSLASARAAARRADISFRTPPTKGEEVLACALNPVCFVFVSWEGLVGPCVNLLLPVKGDIPRWSPQGIKVIPPVVFGRIGPETLQEILDSASRRDFIKPFQKRLEAEKRFLSSLDLEPGLRSIERINTAEKERARTLRDSPFPESCMECPKSMGW